MNLRPLVPVAVVALLAGSLLAAAPKKPAPDAPESKSTTAAPVSPEPPEPPDPGHPTRHRSGGGARGGYGEDVVIDADETYDGDVVCVHGHARIEGHVNGDVTVVLGTLELPGSVAGSVVTVLSNAKLDDATVIEGDLTNVGGHLERNDATVTGQVVNVPFFLPFSDLSSWTSGWGVFAGLFLWWKLFGLFLFFVCALLLAALVPERIRVISEETPVRLFTAFLVGLIGYVVFGMVQIFLTLTVIGIPLVGLLYMIFIILKWLAMCGIFHHVGRRLGRGLGREMSLLGAILLGLVPFAVLRFVPFCVGWSIWFLVEILAFGFLILTRVGTRRSLPIAPAQQPPAPSSAIDPGVSPAS